MTISRRSITRRAVSVSRKTKIENFIDLSITEEMLFPFLVKLIILYYRNEPRFWVPKKQTQVEPLQQTKSHSLRPSAIPSAHTTALNELSSSKASLPRAFVDLLDARLRQIALNNREYANDEQARRIFLAFYAAFDANTQRELSKSKRVEHLLMKFISTSEKEIGKTVDTGYHSNTTDYYTSLFCQLLLDILKNHGYSASHNNLFVQLEKYKVSLSRNAKLNPSVISTGNSTGLNGNNTTPEPPVYPTPSFKVSDISYATQLAKLFNKSEAEIQQAISEYKNEATLENAIAEIKGLSNGLQNNNQSLSYQRHDFDSENDYNNWKETELKNLGNLLETFSAKMASISLIQPATPTLVGDHLCYTFTPSDPRSFFKLLIELLMKQDADTSSDDNSTFVLSKYSQDFLKKVAKFWQISLATRTRIMLFVSEEFYESGLFSLEKLAAEVFPLSERMETEKDGTLDHWTEYDKGLSYATMEKLYKNIVEKVIETMPHIFDIQRPKINPLMEFIVNFILPNVEFEGYSPLDPTPEQIKRAEKLITDAAYEAYTKEIQKLPRDDSFSGVHIAQISDAVISYAQLLQKRYKKPLFQKINIPILASETMLTDFGEDVKHMITHYIDLQLTQNNSIGFEEALVLYSKLSEIRDLYQQLKNKPFPLDIESKFEPFVIQHLKSVSDTLVTWVEPIVVKDTFSPSGNDPEGLTSESVYDLFSSINGATSAINKIKWEDEVQTAMFYTIIMKGVSSSIVKYSELIYGYFQKDLITEEDIPKTTAYKTRRELWMDRALKAVNGAIEVKPYQFQTETCIKLNDIEKSIQNLDQLEAQVNSDKQASLLEQQVRQDPKPGNFFFTIKICEASGLKACDMNGLSDPYVTLIMDEKQIARTRTIYEDLDPVWNETFEMTLSSDRNLILTVWDENAALSHTLCGRTLINIDPHGFRDFEPQDIWLELKPQGRLRINVTMESERDDIRFYFGKSYRTLMRTESDMVRDIVDKFHAFIKYTISLDRLQSLVNPKFNMDTVTNLFKGITIKPKALGRDAIAEVLDPLFDFLNANFSTLFQNLSESLKTKIMTQTWEIVLDTLELLLIPPLSDKRTSQIPLNNMEKEALMIWADALWEFFHHDGKGVSKEALNSRKRQEFVLAATNFYDWSTQELKNMCENSASDSFKTIRARNQVNAMVRRSNTVMAHRNRKALRQEKNKLADAERQSAGQEIIILRILRLRGEYGFVAKRLQQLSSMSETMAAEMYVNASRS